MAEDLRVRDEIIKKFGIGNNSIVDFVQARFVVQLIEQALVCLRQRVEVFSSSIICSKLLISFTSGNVAWSF
jgi:hypothetical protein